MLIAVTGASGFIGSHLVHEIVRRGHRVRAIGRPRRVSAPETDGIERVAVDYADAGMLARALDGANVVIHAAAATRAPTIDALRAANVSVTQRVLDAARAANTGRFVFVSSQAAAGPAASLDAPRTEDDSPAPIEAYGRSKLDAERLLEAQHDVPWTVVRPAAVYGPRDRDFLQLFRLASRGLAIHPANRASWLSVIHVRDVVDGIIRSALDERATRRAYFLGNSSPLQWSTLFSAVATAAGRRLTVDVELPSFLVNVGARFGDAFAQLTGHSPLLNSEKVALSSAPFWVCSSARAHRELGFAPTVSLEQGIAETYAWYIQRGRG